MVPILQELEKGVKDFNQKAQLYNPPVDTPDIVQMQSRHALLQTSINVFGIIHTLSSLKILHLAITVCTDAVEPSSLVYYACTQYAGHFSIFGRGKKRQTFLVSQFKGRKQVGKGWERNYSYASQLV